MGNKFAQSEKDSSKFLDKKEQKLIKKYWPELRKQQPAVFMETWLKAIESSPNIRDIFNISGNEDPRTNETFVGLTKTVGDFFNQLISVWNLEHQKCEEMCKILGANHYKYSQHGFQPIYWDIFMVCLISVIESAQIHNLRLGKRKSVIFAWQKFVNGVVEAMRYGYEQELITENINDS